ncbi:MAG: hypothetical protein CL579_13905 [Alteromonadaceae bacterium]|nr:hypothetical protein [Alteromonadaceae bacterium]
MRGFKFTLISTANSNRYHLHFNLSQSYPSGQEKCEIFDHDASHYDVLRNQLTSKYTPILIDKKSAIKMNGSPIHSKQCKAAIALDN